MLETNRTTITISCPNCNTEGRVQLEENESLFCSSPQRTIKRVEGDFQATVIAETQIQVKCLHCDYEKLFFSGCIRA